MSLTLHWFLSTNGDSRTVVGGHGANATHCAGERPPIADYLGQLATAAETLGFDAVLTPTDAGCEDAWLTTARYVRTGEKPEVGRLEVVSS
ncbi:LLM class flavin-dependent oxidoreductase [Nocardia anaemiae]|uniref:LLM class flavin-dependent oxidoreductase n=1 Tax=Nocardia anaemiae TaxID=263910 RepID=UPI0007A3FCE0